MRVRASELTRSQVHHLGHDVLLLLVGWPLLLLLLENRGQRRRVLHRVVWASVLDVRVEGLRLSAQLHLQVARDSPVLRVSELVALYLFIRWVVRAFRRVIRYLAHAAAISRYEKI